MVQLKKYVTGFIYALPIQLLLLHFRRYQVLLIFWYILFATVSGHFLEPYGANSLYLFPEYLAGVTALSTAIVGFSIGVFIMSWNITTFILHAKRIRFLATTEQPFLKYCVNNGIIPVVFLFVYFWNAIDYDVHQELLKTGDIIGLTSGFLGGFALALFIAFAYFFGADRTIYRRFGNVILDANQQYEKSVQRRHLPLDKSEIRVDWFLSAKFSLRKPRNVKHYSQEFLNTIFQRHHFAAVLAIMLSFGFLLVIGFFSDNRVFQVPAAASITVFFAILIAVAGAISLFMGNWSIPLLVLLYTLLNYLYQEKIIDPSNKAYGLNYSNPEQRPGYDRETIVQLASKENIASDIRVYESILSNWKQRLGVDSPVLIVINTSGGGTRSATFTLNVLQKLDSITNGKLMPHTVLINGASGGTLGAAYFRELYWEKQKGANINLQDNIYSKFISKDLLNPLFTSFVSRDLVGPVRTFEYNGHKYTRDRGYAFEQKLNYNTKDLLNKKLGDYKTAEANGEIPLMFFNSMITRDGREMVIGTHPARFLMKPVNLTDDGFPTDPDAIDFTSFFHRQDPLHIRLLSALRMNATFPYVLPNVWLPSDPVIDVMDAGLRDNFGQQTTLRFIGSLQDWIRRNTSKVVILQIRDRQIGDWDRPYESSSILSFLTKPFLLLQSNWYKLQDYFQVDQLNYFTGVAGPKLEKVSFQYMPSRSASSAALSFHLTATEKKDIEAALNNPVNMQSFLKMAELLK